MRIIRVVGCKARVIAEISDDKVAELICNMYNLTAKLNGSKCKYRAVPDNYKEV
jgi:hypothetical protein